MSAPRERGQPLQAVVAEDDLPICRVVAEQLRAQGFVVREAGNGDEAMHLIQEQRPDLVCLDLSMPVVSGYAVLRWMHADPVLREIPVIVLTARTGLDDYAACREHGAAAVLEKPFRAKALRAAIRRLLEPPGAGEPRLTAPVSDEGKEHR
jgi:CheY-like chemotaxis protein